LSTVFVSLPFDGSFDDVFRLVRDLAARHRLTAVRIDESLAFARPVSDAILHSIRNSKLVIADITGGNPNVLHEVGLAQAMGKPLVLLTQGAPERAPFNVRSLKLIPYSSNDLASLVGPVGRALAEETSPNELLRAMLVPATLGLPSKDSWFVIAASPLSYRRSRGSRGGFPSLRRTSSDYAGIRGILQSFGLLFDFDVLPDLLDPEDYADRVLEEPMNVYCVASPKANRWTGRILNEYSSRWTPRLTFRADPASSDVRNVDLSIFSDEAALQPPGWPINSAGDRYARDFGLIVRGPNPWHPRYMAAVIAGRSSLGTEAASRAFTDRDAVQSIQKRLSGHGISLDDHEAPFWALVSIQRTLGDGREEAAWGSLTIDRVDILQKRR
jgi:hypothetical protein